MPKEHEQKICLKGWSFVVTERMMKKGKKKEITKFVID